MFKLFSSRVFPPPQVVPELIVVGEPHPATLYCGAACLHVEPFHLGVTVAGFAAPSNERLLLGKKSLLIEEALRTGYTP